MFDALGIRLAPRDEGRAVCKVTFAPSGPHGYPLIVCFLLGLVVFMCQYNIFINTRILYFGRVDEF